TRPPARSTRSRIAPRPTPPPTSPKVPPPLPPSSAIVNATMSLLYSRSTSTRAPGAWRAALVSASCAPRWSATLASGPTGAAAPAPRPARPRGAGRPRGAVRPGVAPRTGDQLVEPVDRRQRVALAAAQRGDRRPRVPEAVAHQLRRARHGRGRGVVGAGRALQ